MSAAFMGLPTFATSDTNKPRWSLLYRDLSDLMVALETYTKQAIRVHAGVGDYDDSSKYIHITMSITADDKGVVGVLVHSAEVFALIAEMYSVNGDLPPDSIEYSYISNETTPFTYKKSSFVIGYMRFEHMQVQPMEQVAK